MKICEHTITKKVLYNKKWLLVCDDCKETQRELAESEIPDWATKNNNSKVGKTKLKK